MNPQERLHDHHEILINNIRSLAERTSGTPSDVSLLLSYCNEYLVSHAEAEETTLYTASERTSFKDSMIHEHKEIKHSLDVIDGAFSRGEAEEVKRETRNFIALLNKHFSQEEDVLMPEISAKLSQQELEALISEAHQIEFEKKKSDVWSLFEYDHRRIDANFSSLAGVDREEGMALYSRARQQLLKHIEMEETVLFAVYRQYAAANQMGPVEVMIAEHQEISSLISVPADRIDYEKMMSNAGILAGKLAVHNKKEELVLYPMINRTIPRRDREKIFKECYEALASV